MLERLRHAHRLHRLVLVGFVVLLAAAMMSAASLRADPLDEICHTVQVQAVSGLAFDGHESGHDGMAGHHGPHCLLCVALGLAPEYPASHYRPPEPVAPLPVAQPLVAIVVFVAPPLPARGPPGSVGLLKQFRA